MSREKNGKTDQSICPTHIAAVSFNLMHAIDSHCQFKNLAKHASIEHIYHVFQLS